MTENIIIDIVFRNICFFKYLNLSITDFIIVQNSSTKESEIKIRFIKKNNENLTDYEGDIKLAGNDKADVILKKKEVILDWAFSRKLIKQKNITQQDIHRILDNNIISELIEMFNDKIVKNTFIFVQLYKEIRDNLSFSLNSLILLKNIYNKEKIEEMDKYTELLKKNNKELENYEEGKKKLKKINNELTNQIIILNDKLKFSEDKIATLEGYIPCAEADDFKFNDLKNQIEYLKENEKTLLERINSLELSLEKINKENEKNLIIIKEYKQIIKDNKADRKKTQTSLKNIKLIKKELKYFLKIMKMIKKKQIKLLKKIKFSLNLLLKATKI